MSVLVVGTVAFDDIETPFGRAERVIGGAGTYIAWSSTFIHPSANIVSIIGGDFPKEELAMMNARGIDTTGIEIVEDKKSFFWAGKYHDNMNKRDTITTELNVLADFDPVLPEAYQDDEVLMLGNLTPEIQIKVMDQMKKRPKVIILDTMNFWMDVAMDTLKEAISRVDILTINDEEARQLSGEYSLVNAAEAIHKMGPKYLIIKKGEHGALLFGEDKIFVAPALPIAQVKDPTGAGDCFAGGLSGYLAESGELSFEAVKTGIIYGSTMASYCVEEFSLGKLKQLDEMMIKERLQTFKDITSFSI